MGVVLWDFSLNQWATLTRGRVGIELWDAYGYPDSWRVDTCWGESPAHLGSVCGGIIEETAFPSKTHMISCEQVEGSGENGNWILRTLSCSSSAPGEAV